VRGEYRWHFLHKTRNDLDPVPLLRALLAEVKELNSRDLRVTIDRDPVSFF
jgi:primosomal protein N'